MLRTIPHEKFGRKIRSSIGMSNIPDVLNGGSHVRNNLMIIMGRATDAPSEPKLKRVERNGVMKPVRRALPHDVFHGTPRNFTERTDIVLIIFTIVSRIRSSSRRRSSSRAAALDRERLKEDCSSSG